MENIYKVFVINNREPKNHYTMINEFLEKEGLQYKVLNKYEDEDAECTWYLISEKGIENDKIKETLDYIVDNCDEKFFGHL